MNGEFEAFAGGQPGATSAEARAPASSAVPEQDEPACGDDTALNGVPASAAFARRALAAPRVSILIKALNEEHTIHDCLVAALREGEAVGAEIILVDSNSADRTLEIARQFENVRIVQFADRTHRGCGAAVQLGYQFCTGRYVYVLDGDMVLEPGFLSIAVERLECDASLAGVAGKIIDTRVKTAADARRSLNAGSQALDLMVSDFGGGGLYRRAAIESVDYLAHRWLPGCEEAELGARLTARGWRLIRTSVAAVRHTGHDESNAQMFLRLWRTRRAHAYGMLLRDALRKPWRRIVLRRLWFVLIAPQIHALSLGLGAITAHVTGSISPPVLAFGFDAIVWGCLASALALRKRSFRQAALAIFTWHWLFVASVIGSSRRLPDPRVEIPAHVIC